MRNIKQTHKTTKVGICKSLLKCTNIVSKYLVMSGLGWRFRPAPTGFWRIRLDTGGFSQTEKRGPHTAQRY